MHVPFCDVRCPYCHFTCFVNKDPALPLRWAEAIAREFGAYREAGHFDSIATVYFGGGTPTALPPDARERLAGWLADDVVPMLEDEAAEITVEANPESAWPESLGPLVRAGVNRVSLGIQSMDPAVLEFLGRLNTPRSNLRALDLACSLVDDVSADLIVASPPDSWPSLLRSLEAITSRPIHHVSAYLLEIHAATRFGRDVHAGRWTVKPDEEQETLYLRMGEWLSGRGFEAYELSNFALPGRHARHNHRYWLREPYFGLGPSAHSFQGERRWSNLDDTRAWIASVEAGEFERVDEETLDHRAVRRERILLGLRLREGIPLPWVEGREAWWRRAVLEGWLDADEERLWATPRGWLLLDQIVAELAP